MTLTSGTHSHADERSVERDAEYPSFVRTGGWPYVVSGQDWQGLVEAYATAPSAIAPVAQIVASIASSGRSEDLVFATSMWDLIVTPSPVGEPPVDVVAVRGAMGLATVAADRIVVEHMPLVGPADRIERPASEAVPLFWRFIIEKYGIAPQRS